MTKDLKSQVFQRLAKDGRWAEASLIKDRLIKEARQRGLNKAEAHEEAYREIDMMFRPADEHTSTNNEYCHVLETEEDSPRLKQKPEPNEEGDVANLINQRDEPVEATGARMRSSESTVRGLGEIPASWPQMSSNASQGVEVQWVLANRIRVIREDSDGIVVDLSKALTPAPSYATLGWLETSIRAFAKFVDVSTKASANNQDEAEKVKKERLAIAEIRELLAQMLASGHSK